MTTSAPPRVLIVGLGMIGASFAKALRLSRAAYVLGMDAQPGVADRALELGIIDESVPSAESVPAFDVLVLAVPVLAMESVLTSLKPYLTDQTVISDVGSVKGQVVAAASKALGDDLPSGFVPGHPIAGAERSGVEAAKADLFDRHLLILTPLASSSSSAVALLTELWQAVGAEVVTMSVSRHDEVLAATSHLPHLLAFSLVDTLARESENREIFRYAAGGFRDFTRIAASDPTMWHDVFLANKDATLGVLRRFQGDLEHLAQAIEQGEGRTLLDVFGRAKSARDYFTQILQSRQRHSDDTRRNLIVAPAPQGLSGRIGVPGDRSISHRAVILAALAEGDSEIRGFGENDDNRTTLEALRKLGVVIDEGSDGSLSIKGRGLTGLQAPDSPLYLGQSATSMRLLAGVLSAQSFASELIGDASLSQRPMERLQLPLAELGAHLELTANGTAPIVIQPAQQWQPLDYDLPIASAQVKSAILLAALCAGMPVRLTEPAPSRDHTERLLAELGCRLESRNGALVFAPASQLPPLNLSIPGDFSLAAVHLAAATLVPGSDVTLTAVGVNPSRLGFLDILNDMGGLVTLSNIRDQGGEPVADLRVRCAPLRGGSYGTHFSGRTIDEFPLLFVLAALADGDSRFAGLGELRFKETDRLTRMLDGLRVLGADIEVTDEDVRVRGRGRQPLDGGIVDCAGDPRVALAFMVAAQVARRPVIIRNAGRVLGAYPGFSAAVGQLGYAVTLED
ncbi:3-phosphoshikimate 1-carboxyvinyltransferase [Saccharospirillum sp. HFRX-1]|uniref:3-phosphoshikimate 1-carboxyvinyltransferase n=1 Tax=unclassified Saccharospirillum TaxID=2633430 RepID=UPI0037233095